MNLNSLNFKWCDDLHHLNGRVVTRHNHTFFQTIYIKQGKGILRLNDKKYELSKGDFFIFKPLDYHEYRAIDGEMEAFETKFDLSDKEFYSQLTELENRIELNHEYALKLFSNMLYEYNRENEYNDIAKKAILTEFIIHIIRCGGKAKRKIDNKGIAFLECAKYIERHYRDSLTLDSLAERMHMEKTYFIKQFKKHIGATPLAYLKRVKMEKAKDLIINSDMNITQISDFLGYLSIQHFSNDFKKTMGKSPKEYSHNK